MVLKYKGRFPNHIGFTEALLTDDALKTTPKPEIEDFVMDVQWFEKYNQGIYFNESGRERIFGLFDTKLFPLFIPSGSVPPQRNIFFTPRFLYTNDTLKKLKKDIFDNLRYEERLKEGQIKRNEIIPQVGWQVRFVYDCIEDILRTAQLEILTPA